MKENQETIRCQACNGLGSFVCRIGGHVATCHTCHGTKIQPKPVVSVVVKTEDEKMTYEEYKRRYVDIADGVRVKCEPFDTDGKQEKSLPKDFYQPKNPPYNPNDKPRG